MNPTDRLVQQILDGSIEERELARLAPADVRAIKKAAEGKDPFYKYRVGAPEVVSVDEDTRTITYVLSDETPDRAGDIIRAGGWMLDEYKRNPVVLFCHDWEGLPIGQCPAPRVGTGPDGQTALLGDVTFAPRETYEFADEVYQLCRPHEIGGLKLAPFLRAGSVGLRARKITNVEDEEERQALGLGRWGVVIEQAELLEFSICAIGMNPNAKQTEGKALVEAGIVSERGLDRVMKSLTLTERDLDRRRRELVRRSIVVAKPAAAATGGATVVADESRLALDIARVEGKLDLVLRRLDDVAARGTGAGGAGLDPAEAVPADARSVAELALSGLAEESNPRASADVDEHEQVNRSAAELAASIAARRVKISLG